MAEETTIPASTEEQEKGKSLNFYKNYEESSYQQPNKKGGKKTLFIIIIIILIILLAAGGFIFKSKIKSIFAGVFHSTPTQTSTPEPTPSPTPTPNPLVRSDWSFEVLNGSGVTGLAKKVADKLIGLGYVVVKTGNADKANYGITQILVKSDLKDKVELVVADLRDSIKIASYGGELKDSTPSARIIIGQDLSL